MARNSTAIFFRPRVSPARIINTLLKNWGMDTGTGPRANPQNPSPSEAHSAISNLTKEALAQHIHGAFSAPKLLK